MARSLKRQSVTKMTKGKLVFLGILPFACATETSTYDSFACSVSKITGNY